MKLVFFQVKILPSRIWIEIITNDRYLKMVRKGKSKCEIQDPGINISLREAPTSLPSLAVSCGKTLSSSSLRQRILFFFFSSPLPSFFFFFLSFHDRPESYFVSASSSKRIGKRAEFSRISSIKAVQGKTERKAKKKIERYWRSSFCTVGWSAKRSLFAGDVGK